jgi:hypothetical protein
MRLRHCESGEAVELVEGEITYLGRGVLGVTDKRISRRQLQISLRGPALAVTVYDLPLRERPLPSFFNFKVEFFLSSSRLVVHVTGKE